jgi:hypothetical protein
MKTKFQLAIAFAAGAVIAGAAMQGLRAQVKPHAFAVIETSSPTRTPTPTNMFRPSAK